MSSTIAITSFLDTIKRYIIPEMRVLVSGYRFSQLPLPLMVNPEFTGVVTLLMPDEMYYLETTIDEGFNMQCIEKSTFVYPILEPVDFVCISKILGEGQISERFNQLVSLVKSGGFMFLICPETEYNDILEVIHSEDFECIEMYKKGLEWYILIKRGW